MRVLPIPAFARWQGKAAGRYSLVAVPLRRLMSPTRGDGNRPLQVAKHEQQHRGGWNWGSTDGQSWQFFKWSSHARLAAFSGLTLIASSSEEMKSELEAGNQLIDMLAPALSQLSMGSVMGYATGYALRVVGKTAAFFVGSAFMCVQMAAYKGYIEVNWAKVVKDARGGLLDQDGDGDFDADDVKLLFAKFLNICTYNLPSGAGFTGGLALGLGFSSGRAGQAALAVGTATAIPRTVALLGGAATAGPGVAISLQEYLGGASEQVEAAVNEAQDSEAIFRASLLGADLKKLRAQERELRERLSNERHDATQRDLLSSRISYIEGCKAQVKSKR